MVAKGRWSSGSLGSFFGRGVLVAVVLTAWAITFALPAASAAGPPPIGIATGQDAGWPDVRGWTGDGSQAYQIAPWGFNPLAFSAYATYQYGVRVAIGDVNGDGRPDIVTAPGKGGWTELRVFDGKTFRQLETMLPYRDASWWNGAFVAAGDTNGDGRAEVVDGLDAGCCTSINVVDAETGVATAGFFPYGDRADTGARVATADLNGDGRAELLVLPLGGSRVSAFGTGGGSPFRTYDPFAGEIAGGATIAAGNLLGDSHPELVMAANTPGGVQVKVVDTQSGATLESLAPFGTDQAAAQQVAIGDVNGDGRQDIVLLAQRPDGTQVKAIDADGRQLDSFYVLEPGIVPGASLAAGDLDGDGRAEIVLGGGPTPAAPTPPMNGPDQRVVVYKADGTLVGGFSAYPGLFQGGVRVALADVEHNGRPDVITAPGPGMEPEIGIYSQQWLQSRDRGTRYGHFLAYEQSFTGGVSVAAGYWAGNPEIVVAPGPGRAPEVRVFSPQGRLLSSFAAFEPSYTGGLSVAVGDLNADGTPEIVVGALTGPARIRAFEADGQPYGLLIAPLPADGPGVEVGVADPNGTGRGLILAAAASGPAPLLELLDPLTGRVVSSATPVASASNGLRVGAGDLDHDGRDEILVATGWGGDGNVRVLGGDLSPRRSFQVYSWLGGGMNVAAAPRNGLPLRADGLTLRLRARQRTPGIVVARFHDVGGDAAPSTFRATVDWGDGTQWPARVVGHGRGTYDVRSPKRYARRGAYTVTVTLTGTDNRVSIARSRAVVRAR